MKLPAPVILFALITALFPRTSLVAQANQSDSAFYQSAVNNALAFYRQSARDQSRLYNGREYKPYRMAFINGYPFFLSDQFTKGSIVYEGGFYENVELLYNEVNDMVIINADVRIELISERIDQFTVAGHSFFRLVKDSLNSRFNTGFYERLYSGKIEIYKKEVKFIKDDLSDLDGVRGDITRKRHYYLKKDGEYYPVKNKTDVYDILKERKSEIQQFIKKNGLNFKNDTDNTLAKIAGFYDQLTR